MPALHHTDSFVYRGKGGSINSADTNYYPPCNKMWGYPAPYQVGSSSSSRGGSGCWGEGRGGGGATAQSPIPKAWITPPLLSIHIPAADRFIQGAAASRRLSKTFCFEAGEKEILFFFSICRSPRTVKHGFTPGRAAERGPPRLTV